MGTCRDEAGKGHLRDRLRSKRVATPKAQGIQQRLCHPVFWELHLEVLLPGCINRDINGTLHLPTSSSKAIIGLALGDKPEGSSWHHQAALRSAYVFLPPMQIGKRGALTEPASSYMHETSLLGIEVVLPRFR